MDDFFTEASFATLATCVVAVLAVVGSLRHALNWGPRWFGLILSVAIAFIAWWVTSEMGEGTKTANLGMLKYVIITINGCLIYSSAFGVQNTTIARTSSQDMAFQSAGKGDIGDQGKLSFRSPW